jgi:hypothetical protein
VVGTYESERIAARLHVMEGDADGRDRYRGTRFADRSHYRCRTKT